MTPDADADPTTFREYVEAYRTAVNSEAQHEADTLKDEAMQQVSVGEQVAELSRSLRQKDATIDRVRALTDEWHVVTDRDRTHAPGICHKWHPDCLVLAIRDVLEEPPRG